MAYTVEDAENTNGGRLTGASAIEYGTPVRFTELILKHMPQGKVSRKTVKMPTRGAKKRSSSKAQTG